jgi:alcohol dehydrogenase class IV
MPTRYALSRLQVAATAAILPHLRIPTPLSYVGPDASLTLCRTIAGSGLASIMVVTDRGLLSMGLADRMLQTLKGAGVAVEIFADVEPDPGCELVMAGVEHLKRSRADAVLAIGGGSPIDCAKAINLSHANDCHPSRLAGLWLYAGRRRRGLPFYAVPTTAGTGSEVTMAAVVSDEQRGTKTSIIDPKLLPDAVALDPTLTLGLPAAVTAATGMDALTHAVEAHVSSLAYGQTDRWAVAAARLILANLENAYRDGSDLQAREGMLLGSFLAGLAFTRAGVGYVHAIAHQLGALYHLPHGLANAIVLPKVLDFSLPHCSDRLATLARSAGLAGADQDDEAAAHAFVAKIRQLGTALSIPQGVEALRKEDFTRIVDQAFAEAHGTYGVPRYLRRTEAYALLDRLLPAPQARAA